MKKKKASARTRKRPAQNNVDLLSTLSHEVRTPLTSIGGYIKLILGGGAGPLTDTQKDYLSIVDKNVDRLARLINQILDYQVLTSGEIPMIKEILHLGPILRECCDTFKLAASKKGLRLLLTAPDSLRPVFGDRSRLTQIFVNLISNAIKFTSAGSIKIDASDGRGGLLVRVEDTGMGLGDADRKKLFKKFFRAKSEHVADEGGSGLGLAITYGLVKSHGGKISVKSEKGKGTAFSVVLPAALVLPGN